VVRAIGARAKVQPKTVKGGTHYWSACQGTTKIIEEWYALLERVPSFYQKHCRVVRAIGARAKHLPKTLQSGTRYWSACQASTKNIERWYALLKRVQGTT